VGSVLCGSKDFIRRAHRIRKQLGGGMRQGGVLAAAGIVALETMVERLAEDHRRAKILARELAAIPGLKLVTEIPETNMVYIELLESVPMQAAQVAQQLTQRSVLVGVVGARRFRLVTHYYISDEAVDQAVTAFTEVLASLN